MFEFRNGTWVPSPKARPALRFVTQARRRHSVRSARGREKPSGRRRLSAPVGPARLPLPSALNPFPFQKQTEAAANSFILLPSTDPAGNRLRVFLGLRRKMKEKLKMHKKPLSFSVSVPDTITPSPALFSVLRPPHQNYK